MLYFTKIRPYLSSLLYVFCVGLLLFFQRSSIELQVFYVLGFALYLGLFFWRVPLQVLLALALVLRVVCFFKMPFLSDDFIAFIGMVICFLMVFRLMH